MFFLEGETWKSVRSVVTPAITSGKLRKMGPVMNQCIDRLIDRLNKLTINGPKVFAAKKTAVQFTVEVIGATNFGIETNTDEDDYNAKMSPVLHNATKIIDITACRLVALYSFPLWLNNLLGVKHDCNYEATDYFINLCRQIVKQRRANPTSRRDDIVQLLIDGSVSLEEIEKSGYDKLTASADQGK